MVEVLGRGLYRKAEASPGDLTLAEAVNRASRATVCLTGALVFHDLSDAIPAAEDLALPRGTRLPRMCRNVTWHVFHAVRFDLGRERRQMEDGQTMGVYDAERTLVDTFRLRHRQGEDEAYEVLRRWLRRPGTQPSRLLAMAGHFPRVLPMIRQSLAVLL